MGHGVPSVFEVTSQNFGGSRSRRRASHCLRASSCCSPSVPSPKKWLQMAEVNVREDFDPSIAQGIALVNLASQAPLRLYGRPVLV